MTQQYLDTSVSSGRSVFSDIISPLLAMVRLHPLLVTQNREHEKTTTRWKGLAEVHDVVDECSRHSLDVYESASRGIGSDLLHKSQEMPGLLSWRQGTQLLRKELTIKRTGFSPYMRSTKRGKGQ